MNYVIDSLLKETDNLIDKLCTPVDKNIKYIVASLRCRGFNTIGSCQGHLDYGLPYPWIDIDHHHFNLNFKNKNNLLVYLNKFKIDKNIFIENFGIFGAFRLRGCYLSDIELLNILADFLVKK